MRVPAFIHFVLNFGPTGSPVARKIQLLLRDLCVIPITGPERAHGVELAGGLDERIAFEPVEPFDRIEKLVREGLRVWIDHTLQFHSTG